MSRPKTVLAKYVFLDIVGYTQNRSVEAQVYVIGELNRIVLEATKEVLGKGSERPDEMATGEPTHKVLKNVIFIPAGDGMCICTYGDEYSYDSHLRLAKQILIATTWYTRMTTDPMRHIQLRIGVNQNVDNLVVDINRELNIAGSGINTAQRLMDSSEPGTIRVGQSVYDMLHQREEYMNMFERFDMVVKHDTPLTTYLYKLNLDQLVENYRLGRINSEATKVIKMLDSSSIGIVGAGVSKREESQRKDALTKKPN